MNTLTKIALLSVVSVVASVATGCAAPVESVGSTESTGTSEAAVTAPPAMPGTQVCPKGGSCSMVDTGVYVNSSLPCTHVYAFSELNVGVKSYYFVTYCADGSLVDSFASAHASSSAPPLPAGGFYNASASYTQATMPKAPTGGVYLRFDYEEEGGIKCTGLCPNQPQSKPN
jgi:hypothetical protein